PRGKNRCAVRPRPAAAPAWKLRRAALGAAGPSEARVRTGTRTGAGRSSCASEERHHGGFMRVGAVIKLGLIVLGCITGCLDNGGGTDDEGTGPGSNATTSGGTSGAHGSSGSGGTSGTSGATSGGTSGATSGGTSGTSGSAGDGGTSGPEAKCTPQTKMYG